MTKLYIGEKKGKIQPHIQNQSQTNIRSVNETKDKNINKKLTIATKNK